MKRRLNLYTSYTEEPGKEDSRHPKYPVCEKMHDLDLCEQLNNVSIQERGKIVQKKRLCFASFSPITDDHNAKNFNDRKTCNICKQKHPSSLHGYVPKGKAGITTQGTFEPDKNLIVVNNGRKNSTVIDLNLQDNWYVCCTNQSEPWRN